MNDERKQKLIRATALLGQARDTIEAIRDEEAEQYDELTAEQQESRYGDDIQENIDDMENVIDELDAAQNAMVDLNERLAEKEEEQQYVRSDAKLEQESEDRDRDVFAMLGITPENVDKFLPKVQRFLKKYGVEFKYEIKTR